MTKERLEGMPLSTLLELCRKENLEVDPQQSRQEIIEELFEAFEEDRRERESLKNLIIKIEESKFSVYLDDEEPESPVFEGSQLPDHYDETRVGLVLRDPNWAFSYWEVRPSDQELFSSDILFRHYTLRVYEMETPGTQGTIFFTIPLDQSQGSRYINLPSSGKYYRLELHGAFDRESRLLTSSGEVYSPQEEFSYKIPTGPEGDKQRKILELSGLSLCETMKQTSHEDPTPEKSPSAIPQRIGDLDEELFLETGSIK